MMGQNVITEIVTRGDSMIHPSHESTLLSGLDDVVAEGQFRRRAIKRALHARCPLPSSFENVDEEASALLIADTRVLERCAMATSCLPRAGRLTNTVDGRFLRAIRRILTPDDMTLIDSYAERADLPKSLMAASAWHNESKLLFGGIQNLLMELEFGDAFASFFSLRFPSETFDAEPSIDGGSSKLVRQVCRTILQLNRPS